MRKASAQLEQPPSKNEEEVVEKVEKVEEPDFDVEIEGEEPAPEPVVKVEAKVPEKKDEDDRAALLKRMEELQRSEELAKRRAAEVERQLSERQTDHEKITLERDRFRLDSETNQLDAIVAAMAAAKAEADHAELAIEQAIQDANPKGQAEAHRRLAKAEGNLARLQDGKEELEYRISLLKTERREPERKVEKVEKEPEKEERPDVIEAMPIPDRAKEWLRENREFAEDPRKNAKLQVAHWDALDEGHKEFSTSYFEAVERLLGMREKSPAIEEAEEDDQEVEIEPVRKPAQREQRRSAIVSAPVSREGSTTTGAPSRTQVRLTKEEADFAEQIGMSHAEFAKQKIKLQEMKRKGEIQ